MSLNTWEPRVGTRFQERCHHVDKESTTLVRTRPGAGCVVADLGYAGGRPLAPPVMFALAVTLKQEAHHTRAVVIRWREPT